MQTCAATANSPPARAAALRPAEAGFTLIEMLVAMALLSLVGLTLARFQTFQLTGTANIAAATAARLEADNVAVDVLVMPAAPISEQSGVSRNMGRDWAYSLTPRPAPDPALMPELVRVDIAVALQPGGPPLASRTILRPRGRPAQSMAAAR